MVCLQIVRISTVEGWSVGREQISQMVCSGSLVPCLIHNGCVTMVIVYITVHAHGGVPLAHKLLCSVGICELHLGSGGVTAS